MRTDVIATCAVFGFVLGMVGCTSHYVPSAEADGVQIFADACARCHAPKDASGEVYFTMDAEDRAMDALIDRIRNGGILMPSFPNLSYGQVLEVASFVHTHSVVEE